MKHPVLFDRITKLIYVDNPHDLPDRSLRLVDNHYDFNADYVFLRSWKEITIELPRHYFMHVTPDSMFGLDIATRLAQRLIPIPGVARITPYLLVNSNVGLDVTRYGTKEWHKDVLKPISQAVKDFCDRKTWQRTSA